MRLHRGGPVILAFAAVVTVTACTGGNDDGHESRPSPSSGPSERTVVKMSDRPGAQKGYAGAAKDAEVKSCKASSGTLRVKGAVSNPKTKRQHYRIYVSAMDGKVTRGVVQVDVRSVPGGGSEDWKASARLTGKDIRCVLRVERFAAKG